MIEEHTQIDIEGVEKTQVDLKYIYKEENVEKTKLVNEVFDEVFQKCGKSADKMSVESMSPLMSPLLQMSNVGGGNAKRLPFGGAGMGLAGMG